MSLPLKKIRDICEMRSNRKAISQAGKPDEERVTAHFAAARQDVHAGGQKRLPELETLLEEVSSHWGCEDPFYRFNHQSFKVYGLQESTGRIVEVLRSLAPERPLNPWFERIIAEGTGRCFEMEHNRRWLDETRPILEAFFHARIMLEMAVRYGRELKTAPGCLPSGWAALLYLYGLR